MNKKFLLIISFNVVCYLSICQNFLKSPVINKIIYPKELIDFNQTVMITIYLTPMKVIDVNIFFNDKEVTNLNKNLKPFDNNYDNFFPLITFEITNLNKENILHIFVTLSEGLVVDAIEKLAFYKAIIIDEKNNKFKNIKTFYIKIGENIDGFFYDIRFNKNIIRKIEDIFCNNVIYSKFDVLNKGVTKFSIYQFKEEDLLIKAEDVYNVNKAIKEFDIIIE